MDHSWQNLVLLTMEVFKLMNVQLETGGTFSYGFIASLPLYLRKIHNHGGSPYGLFMYSAYGTM